MGTSDIIRTIERAGPNARGIVVTRMPNGGLYMFNVFHADIVSSRVGWTNLAADSGTNRIYAHGTQGFLMCLDGATGKVVWQRSLTEESSN